MKVPRDRRCDRCFHLIKSCCISIRFEIFHYIGMHSTILESTPVLSAQHRDCCSRLSASALVAETGALYALTAA